MLPLVLLAVLSTPLCCTSAVNDVQGVPKTPTAALATAVPAAAAAAAAAAAVGPERTLFGLSAHSLATRNRKRCEPSMLTLARQQPQLSKLVELAGTGYNVFANDEDKPLTLLAPNDAALQLLAEGCKESEQQLLVDSLYSLLLYHQIPRGAYDDEQLVKFGLTGMVTALGEALKKRQYEISFDGRTPPLVVATGGWAANNANLLSSFQACDGSWVHVMDRVLLPTQKLSNLPRLVDTSPNNTARSGLWLLLAATSTSSGSNSSSGSTTGNDGRGSNSSSMSPVSVQVPAQPVVAKDGAVASPPPAPAPAPKQRPHTNATGTVISSGSRKPAPAKAAYPTGATGSDSTKAASEGLPSSASSASSTSSTSNQLLVIAASVAGGAVAVCAAVVAAVLLRKRAVRRRRQREHHARLVHDEELDHSSRKNSGRSLQLHVDA